MMTKNPSSRKNFDKKKVSVTSPKCINLTKSQICCGMVDQYIYQPQFNPDKKIKFHSQVNLIPKNKNASLLILEDLDNTHTTLSQTKLESVQ